MDTSKNSDCERFRICGAVDSSNAIAVQDLVEGWWVELPACRVAVGTSPAETYICAGRDGILSEPRLARALAGRLGSGQGPLPTADLMDALRPAGPRPTADERVLTTPRWLAAWLEHGNGPETAEPVLRATVLVWTVASNLERGKDGTPREEVINELVRLGHDRHSAEAAVQLALTCPAGSAALFESKSRRIYRGCPLFSVPVPYRFQSIGARKGCNCGALT